MTTTRTHIASTMDINFPNVMLNIYTKVIVKCCNVTDILNNIIELSSVCRDARYLLFHFRNQKFWEIVWSILELQYIPDYLNGREKLALLRRMSHQFKLAYFDSNYGITSSLSINTWSNKLVMTASGNHTAYIWNPENHEEKYILPFTHLKFGRDKLFNSYSFGSHEIIRIGLYKDDKKRNPSNPQNACSSTSTSTLTLRPIVKKIKRNPAIIGALRSDIGRSFINSNSNYIFVFYYYDHLEAVMKIYDNDFKFQRAIKIRCPFYIKKDFIITNLDHKHNTNEIPEQLTLISLKDFTKRKTKNFNTNKLLTDTNTYDEYIWVESCDDNFLVFEHRPTRFLYVYDLERDTLLWKKHLESPCNLYPLIVHNESYLFMNLMDLPLRIVHTETGFIAYEEKEKLTISNGYNPININNTIYLFLNSEISRDDIISKNINTVSVPSFQENADIESEPSFDSYVNNDETIDCTDD